MMKKEELIRRLEHLRCDPTGVFLEELIEELKAEKPKVKAETERGFLLERSDGNERTFYSWAGDWTPHLQEAHLFKVLEYVMEKQAMFRLGSRASRLASM